MITAGPSFNFDILSTFIVRVHLFIYFIESETNKKFQVMFHSFYVL